MTLLLNGLVILGLVMQARQVQQVMPALLDGAWEVRVALDHGMTLKQVRRANWLARRNLDETRLLEQRRRLA